MLHGRPVVLVADVKMSYGKFGDLVAEVKAVAGGRVDG
jgi:hypothetical protein